MPHNAGMVTPTLAEWAATQAEGPPPPAMLTKHRSDVIVKIVSDGAKEDKAAEAAGVTVSDIAQWMDWGGLAGGGKYREFRLSLLEARLDADLREARVGKRVSIPLRYEPHDYQRKLHSLQLDTKRKFHRFIAACCGRRGGKTYGGAAHFAARVMADQADKLAGRGRWEGQPHHPWKRGEGREPQPFLYYWLVAPTYALLDEPKIALQRVLGRESEGGVIVHQTDKTWWLLGGIRIDFRSGDRPDRLVSVGLDGLWCDEAARLKPAVWRDNLRPTLSDKNGWALFTTTPLGKNWFWSDIWAPGSPDAAAELASMTDRTAKDVLDDEFACISWFTADNTSIPALAAEMEIAKRQMPRALYERNYLASFEAFEGQCFDLDRDRHLRATEDRLDVGSLTHAWTGLDIGLADHPSVLCIVARGRDGRFHEIKTEVRHKCLPFHADAWRERDYRRHDGYMANVAYTAINEALGDGMWDKIPLYCPADNSDWADYLTKAGFNVQRAFQRHEPAVTWASVALVNDMLTIGSGQMWRCLVNLRYPGDGESSTKLWVDKDDDAWDALRYALTDMIRQTRFGVLPVRVSGAGLMAV